MHQRRLNSLPESSRNRSLSMLRTSESNQEKLSKGEVPVLSPKGLRAVNEDYFKTMMRAFFEKAATKIRDDNTAGNDDDLVRTSGGSASKKDKNKVDENKFLMAEHNGLMKFLRPFKSCLEQDLSLDKRQVQSTMIEIEDVVRMAMTDPQEQKVQMKDHAKKYVGNQRWRQKNNAWLMVGFNDLYSQLQTWFFANMGRPSMRTLAKNPMSPTATKKVMTDGMLKSQLINLFERHDENRNGYLEKGVEFDKFILDFLSLIPAKMDRSLVNFSSATSPRDDYRDEIFKGINLDRIQRFTLDEVFPHVRRYMKDNGLLMKSTAHPKFDLSHSPLPSKRSKRYLPDEKPESVSMGVQVASPQNISKPIFTQTSQGEIDKIAHEQDIQMLTSLVQKGKVSEEEGDFHVLIDGYNGFKELNDPQECFIMTEIDQFERKGGFSSARVNKEKADQYDGERQVLRHDMRIKFDPRSDKFDSNTIADRVRLSIAVVCGRRREESQVGYITIPWKHALEKRNHNNFYPFSNEVQSGSGRVFGRIIFHPKPTIRNRNQNIANNKEKDQDSQQKSFLRGFKHQNPINGPLRVRLQNFEGLILNQHNKDHCYVKVCMHQMTKKQTKIIQPEWLYLVDFDFEECSFGNFEVKFDQIVKEDANDFLDGVDFNFFMGPPRAKENDPTLHYVGSMNLPWKTAMTERNDNRWIPTKEHLMDKDGKGRMGCFVGTCNAEVKYEFDADAGRRELVQQEKEDKANADVLKREKERLEREFQRKLDDQAHQLQQQLGNQQIDRSPNNRTQQRTPMEQTQYTPKEQTQNTMHERTANTSERLMRSKKDLCMQFNRAMNEMNIDVRTLFDRIDTSNDQKIQWKEFMKMFEQVNFDVTDQDAKLWFDSIDLDGSGTITKLEFYNDFFNTLDKTEEQLTQEYTQKNNEDKKRVDHFSGGRGQSNAPLVNNNNNEYNYSQQTPNASKVGGQRTVANTPNGGGKSIVDSTDYDKTEATDSVMRSTILKGAPDKGSSQLGRKDSQPLQQTFNPGYEEHQQQQPFQKEDTFNPAQIQQEPLYGETEESVGFQEKQQQPTRQLGGQIGGQNQGQNQGGRQKQPSPGLITSKQPDKNVQRPTHGNYDEITGHHISVQEPPVDIEFFAAPHASQNRTERPYENDPATVIQTAQKVPSVHDPQRIVTGSMQQSSPGRSLSRHSSVNVNFVDYLDQKAEPRLGKEGQEGLTQNKEKELKKIQSRELLNKTPEGDVQVIQQTRVGQQMSKLKPDSVRSINPLSTLSQSGKNYNVPAGAHNDWSQIVPSLNSDQIRVIMNQRQLKQTFDNVFNKHDKNKDKHLLIGPIFDTFWNEFERFTGYSTPDIGKNFLPPESTQLYEQLMKKNNGNLNYEDAWKLAKAFYDERASIIDEQLNSSNAPAIKQDPLEVNQVSSDRINPDQKQENRYSNQDSDLQETFDKVWCMHDRNKEGRLELGKSYDSFWNAFKQMTGLSVEANVDLNRLQMDHGKNTGYVAYEDALKHAIDYMKSAKIQRPKTVGSLANQINQRGLGNNLDSDNKYASHSSISPVGRQESFGDRNEAETPNANRKYQRPAKTIQPRSRMQQNNYMNPMSSNEGTGKLQIPNLPMNIVPSGDDADRVSIFSKQGQGMAGEKRLRAKRELQIQAKKPADLSVEDHILKNDFIKSLMKIHTPVTLQVGKQECERFIDEGRHMDKPKKMVSIAISALTDKTVMQHTANLNNPTSLGIHAQLFGYLSKVNKREMINPREKPALRRTTLDRIWYFMRDQLFTRANNDVSRGCAIAMIEILEHTFFECLDPNKPAYHHIFQDFFFEPLLACFEYRKSEVNTNKPQKRSASFVLRVLIGHIMQCFPHLMTDELQYKIIKNMLKNRVYDSEYLELCMTLIRYNKFDITQVFNGNWQGAFNFSICTVTALAVPLQSEGQFLRLMGHFTSPTQTINQSTLSIQGQKDMIAAMQLQQLLVSGASEMKKLVIDQFSKDARRALHPVLMNGNKTVKEEAKALWNAWKLLSHAEVLENDLEGLQSQQSIPGYRDPRPLSSYDTGPLNKHKKFKQKQSNFKLAPARGKSVTRSVPHQAPNAKNKSVQPRRKQPRNIKMREQLTDNDYQSHFIRSGMGNVEQQQTPLYRDESIEDDRYSKHSLGMNRPRDYNNRSHQEIQTSGNESASVYHQKESLQSRRMSEQEQVQKKHQFNQQNLDLQQKMIEGFERMAQKIDFIERQYEERLVDKEDQSFVDGQNEQLARNNKQMFDALQSSINSYQHQMDRIMQEGVSPPKERKRFYERNHKDQEVSPFQGRIASNDATMKRQRENEVGRSQSQLANQNMMGRQGFSEDNHPVSRKDRMLYNANSQLDDGSNHYYRQ